MATKFLKKREVAKLVTENGQPCVFCNQDVDDEVIFGKLYSYGDIQCHYFCVLLSCCLVQKGRDSEGLFGFLYKDIVAEVERSKKHKCSYCGRGGASLGCSVAACRKQFHLPCGRQKNAVSLFYGNYKSFCELHAPKQKISTDVMAKAKERMKIEKLKKAGKIPVSGEGNQQAESPEDSAMVCVICYEPVQAYPTTQTFWPPCCGRDAWLHRTCLQRMALSAGMHYLKCPLCNDKDNFYDAVCEQGYYLPDRDAAWELEQNAFAEIYNREARCAAAECRCPFGRSHDELGTWDIKLCLLCGSWGLHSGCSPAPGPGPGPAERAVCGACAPAATDLDQLETRLTEVIMAEQAAAQQRARSAPVMPSRMSLRRTKGRLQAHSATSSSQILPTHKTQINTESQPAGRLELNLKTPRRPKLLTPPTLKELESKLLSPIKLLEQSYLEKGGRRDVVVPGDVLDKIRLRFSKPRPLSAKKKIVNEILDDLFKNVFKENPKSKDPLREWNSPKKSCDITSDLNEAVKGFMEPTLNTNEEVQETTDVKSTKVDEDGENQHENDRENLEETSDILDENSSDKENNINHINGNDKNDNDVKSDEESSSSTFRLAPEFIADSDDSLPIIDTPKKLKMVDIKQDSIEISKKDEIVNIDVVQTHGTQIKTESQPADRLELNLKTPRRPKLLTPPTLKELESKLLSPIKLLEQSYLEKGGRRDVVVPGDVLDKIRLRFSKPRPLSAKKKIVNEILDDLFKNVFKENPKSKDPLREWNSPKKSCDITSDLNEAVKGFKEPTLNTNEEVQETTDVKSTKVDEDGENQHENDRENLEETSDILDENSSDKENNINHINGNDKNDNDVKSDEESSSSTFRLAPEFIADSDDSLPIIDTPKKLKMVDIKQDSIEISKKDEIVNIDVVQIGSGKEKEFVKSLDLKSPVKNKMFSFKFSPLDKEPLKTDVDMDVESFKDQYLNEVDRDKCVKDSKNEERKKVDSIDKKCKKRKLEMKEEVRKKRKKDGKQRDGMKHKKIKLKIKAMDPEKAGQMRTKKIKKMKELHKKIRDKHVSIKIKLKDGNKCKIKKSKKIQKVKSYKQYVLKYSPLLSSNIAKPETDVTPMKRKHTKIEKSPSDKLVQTSIQSFFKVK